MTLIRCVKYFIDCFLFSVTCFAFVSFVSADEVARDSLKDACTSWRRYLELGLHAGGSFHFVAESPPGTKLFEDHAEVKCFGEQWLSIWKNSDYPCVLSARNHSYAFKLESESFDGPWVIRELDRGNQRTPDNILGTGLRGSEERANVVFCVVCPGVRINSFWIPQLVDHPDFKIVSCSQKRRKGLDVVDVTFDLHDPGDGCPLRSGTLSLLPEKLWVIQSANMKGSWAGGSQTGTIEVENTYSAESMEEFPVMIRSEQRHRGRRDNGEPFDAKFTSEYEISRLDRVNDEEFRLSHYGLPEPPSSSGSAKLYWFIFFALCAMVCAITWKRLARQ